jgi:hypothetical protein
MSKAKIYITIFKAKNMLFIAFLLGTVHSLQAQSSWGVRVGSGLSTIGVRGPNPGGFIYSVKPIYVSGVYHNWKLSRKWGITAEMLYAAKGAKEDNPIHLHYVNIPVMFNYYFVDGRLRFELGPEYGYLIAARSKGNSASQFWSNRLDLSANFGVAFHITEELSIGTRTNYGFLDVTSIALRDGNNASAGETVFRNRTVQFALTYRLHSSKKA